jgi:hypothetical protein
MLHEGETVSTSIWHPVGAVDPRKLGEARREAHNAAQWPVRLAHSYMAPQPQARHTLLRWDPPRQALVTQEFLAQLTVELRIPELTLQFKEDGRAVPHVIEVDGRTPAEIEAWILVELLHRGIDRDRFSKALPYDFPDLMTGDTISYTAKPLAAELGELSIWFANAASRLRAIEKEYLAPTFGSASAVWCWPKAFDLAILVPMHVGADGPMLRAGFSPGTSDCGEPHFYVAPETSTARATAGCHAGLTATRLLQEAQPAEAALNYLRRQIAIHRKRAAD